MGSIQDAIEDREHTRACRAEKEWLVPLMKSTLLSLKEARSYLCKYDQRSYRKTDLDRLISNVENELHKNNG